jgi:prevent-host-death family protein
MTEVGVRELKAHLSEHLQRVRNGTRLTVTDRGRAIATISPVDQPEAPAWALKMVADGLARWNGGKPQGMNPRLPSKGKSASKMVIEDRR